MKEDLEDLESKLLALKNTGRLIAVKAEFEAEGTRIDELGLLSNACFKNDIPLTLKTGGPSAIRDIFEAFQLGAQIILIPMVESEYSLEYFIEPYKQFSYDFEGLNEPTKLAINIESKLGYKNINKILDSITNKSIPISFIVIGRSDLSSSLNESEVNSEKIFSITKDILSKTSASNIKCTIGGNITSKSYEFLSNLKEQELYAFETRKTTFKFSSSISKKEFESIIKLSLEFERAWLKLKSSMYSLRSNEENARISTINKRLRSDIND